MHRQALLRLLGNYTPVDPDEKVMKAAITSFVQTHSECFDRSLLKGHVTASGWVVNREKTHALLIHHVKLNKWLQPGGHCDGDPDPLKVAVKETFEETDILAVPATEQLFDVDIHRIPARTEIPEHLHYDIRFLLQAEMTEDTIPANSEAREIKWVRLDEIEKFTSEESVLRMVKKIEVPRSQTNSGRFNR